MCPRISIRGSVRWSVGLSVTHFFSMSQLWEKMVGNDLENSLNAPNLLESLPNYPKMSIKVQFRRNIVRTDLFSHDLRHRPNCNQIVYIKCDKSLNQRSLGSKLGSTSVFRTALSTHHSLTTHHSLAAVKKFSPFKL